MIATRRRVLDLYGCEGGAAKGYMNAGYDVYTVEIDPRFAKRYPGTGFHAGDVLVVMAALLRGESIPFTLRDGAVEWLSLSDFAFIHASPPCQHASAGTRTLRAGGKEYPALIEPTRGLLIASGLPWVIENVRGADLREPMILCGSMFGLGAFDEDNVWLHLERHRGFESNVDLTAPGPCAHQKPVAGVYGGARSRRLGATAAEHREDARLGRGGGYVPQGLDVRRRLLGIDWMTTHGMNQAIPPAYAEWVGLQMRQRALAATEVAA